MSEMTKPKKILVLVGEVSRSGEIFLERVREVSTATYLMGRYADIAVIIQDGKLRCVLLDQVLDIAEVDLVYLRGITDGPIRHAVATYLKSKGVPVINSESHHFQSISKLEQYSVLAAAGIPVPDTVFVSRDTYRSQVPSLLGADYPLIAKSIVGRNGNDNVMVKNEQELLAATVPEALYQPFIPNQFDYRVIVADDQVVVAYKRVRDEASESYKNNISQGGHREVVVLSDELTTMAIGAARALGREFGGVDILTNSENQTSVVLEVNFNFGPPSFDAQTQHDYNVKLAQFLESKAK